MNIEEQIIRLLENDLDDKDRIELEKMVEENPELKQDQALYEQIILAIREKGEDELRAELDEYLKDHLSGRKEKKVLSINKYLIYIGMAASVSLVVLFFYPSGNNLPKDIPADWEINSIPDPADTVEQETDSLKQDVDALKIAE